VQQTETIPDPAEWLSSVNTTMPEVIRLHGSIELAYPIGNAARLLQRQYESPWGAGTQLAEYETSISDLLEFNKLNQFPSFAVGNLAYIVENPPFVAEIAREESLVDEVGPTISTWNFDELLEKYFAQPTTFAFANSRARIPVQQNSLLQWIVCSATVSCLLEQLFRRVKKLKQAIYWNYFGFCGLTWTRRIWFLLHGSHPPKSEPRLSQSPAFGCA
jgi:hypothetical protein